MYLGFYGAAREVTGSKHMLRVNGKNILLDCGLFQGHRKKAREKNEKFLFDPKKIDYVILSHAHMDHSGLLPMLVKKGYEGPILTTSATRDLCTYMLQDSAFIQEKEVDYLLKHKQEIVEPLYSAEDVFPTLGKMLTVPYNMAYKVCEGVTLTFLDAGHILGSAMVILEVEEKGNKKTITFTGDLGRKGLPILKDPSYIDRTDILITESTYGNRFHKFIDDVDVYLEELLNKAIARGGKIIIPAFALERTQEVVYYTHLLIKQGRIPKIPIFVDSPLATNVTDVFRGHPECFDKSVYDEFFNENKNPFGFGMLKYTNSVEDSKKLNDINGPMIIISASGMCEFGRILHHLKNNVSDPKNLILIVGYQAENTLGRKLVDGDKQVKILGEYHDVKAEVKVVDAFSGHADRSDLIDFVSHTKDIKEVFIVHGEENQGLTFKEILKDVTPNANIIVPRLGESFEVGKDY